METEDFSFRHLVIDSVGDFFHVDSKFYSTLKVLFLKPGRVTVEYLEGKRARHLQPFKLFLFISVVYFLLMFSGAGQRESQNTESSGKTEMHSDAPEISTSFNLGESKMSIDTAKALVRKMGLEAFMDSVNPGMGRFEKKLYRAMTPVALDHGENLQERMMHNASKVVFLLIPVLALILKLLYIRRKRLFYDHLIFALYTHAIFFLVLILFELLSLWIDAVPIWPFVLLILVYFVMALHTVYAQSWGKTLLKALLSCLAYLVIALPVFFIFLLLFSVFV